MVRGPSNPFRRTLLLASALVVLGCERGPGPPQEAWRRAAGGLALGELNVVLVTIDTLRADRLGCYGYGEVATPHLDRLAREGVRFAHAVSTVPFTLPAHGSIMTGSYPPRHGIRENVGYALDAGLPTLAERLRAAGRDTAGFVSAFVLDGRWGIGRGFDRYHDDFDLRGMGANLASAQRDGAETLAAARQWLEGRTTTTPFFLWLHLYDPHDPYTPPEPFRSRYPQRPYDGEVAYADSLVGELTRTLEERGLLERTLLVVTADHGEGLGQHGEGFHGYYVYDATVRVPLIVRVPFGDFGGRVIEAAVSHVDLMPTILAAVGHEVPAGVQGESLLGLILGQDDGGTGRAVYSESFYPLLHYGWAPLRALRTARYKYVDAPSPELYDVAEDPEERENLLLDRRPVSRDLHDRLRALTAELDAGAREAPAAAVDEEALAQLQALGYVAGRGEVTAAGDGERADPKDKIGLHRRIMQAQSVLGQGEDAAAERLLEEVLAEDAAMIDPHQMLGQVALRRDDYAGAVERFSAALALDPDHKGSLFGLAQAYRRLGRRENALVGFRRLLELDPNDAKSALAAAEIHAEKGRFDEALALLDAAAGAAAAPALVANQRGEVLVLMGRADDAATAFRQAIAANAEPAQPRFNLAVLLEERGDAEGASRLYEEALERAPRHFQAQFNLSRLAGRRGDLDRQQELLEASIASNPDFVRGYYFLAKLLMDRGGDLARAEALAREGLSRDLEHVAGPLGFFLLADLMNRAGRPREAQEALAQARAIQGG